MGDYGRTSGTGGPQSAAITNDDEYTLDLPEQDDVDDDKELGKVMPKGAY